VRTGQNAVQDSKESDIQPATGEPTAPVTVGPNAPTSAARQEAAATIAAGADFGLSETLFKNVPSLKAIFDEYVNPKSGMTDDEFRKRIRNDVWFKKNSREIKTRFVQYYNFRDLQESGQAEGSTDYEQQISRIERNLAKRAVEIGSAAASDPIALRKAAENLYITNREDDTTFVDDFLAAAIRPVSGMIGGKPTEGYSGQALQNYNALLQTARNNGFQINDILPGGANEQQVLANIASGNTATSPGGVNTNIQFNSAGTFGGNVNYSFDVANARVTLQGHQVFGNTATAPAAVANSVAVFHNAEGSGGTGLYVKSPSVEDELVSKSKAIVFAIIF
jgi:hypothetical protein